MRVLLKLGRAAETLRGARAPGPFRDSPIPQPERWMSELQVTVRLTIHGGKLSEFKEVAAQLMQSVRENDSGTLQYDWFFNADQGPLADLG